MSLVLKTAPSVEPVTLADAKGHLRVVGTEEDSLLTSLITAARVFVETHTGLFLLTQTWTFHGRPRGECLEIPRGPVQSVARVAVMSPEGTERVLDSSAWTAHIAGGRAHVTLPTVLGTAAVEFTAGYGAVADKVPAPLRQAILQLVARWYEHRGDEPQEMVPLPTSVTTLLAPYRRVRL